MGPAELIVVLALVALWFVPAHLVARYAEREKGQNYLLFLVIGLFLSFIVELVLALLISPNQQALAFGVSAGGSESRASELERLAKLHADGDLSADEYARAKSHVLDA
ncbi:MAG: SHOCT domain-containing protein [Solirubrobacteraceae bacterium]|nr:SHOCT domain-containing protein [Solirubrobacteraceae bacterium]